MKHVLIGIAFATAASAVLPSAGLAQADFPMRPVRIICDCSPGSPNDVVARTLAEALSRMWKQPVAVDGHPGASGSNAARVAAVAVKASKDGYTLFMASASAFTALPGVADNLPIQIPRDFLPATIVAQQPMVIAASPASGITTVPDLIARAKAKPGEIVYAAAGRGHITNLTMELLQLRAGVKLQMTVSPGGEPLLADAAANRVQVVLDTYNGLSEGLRSGAIKGVAIAALEPLPGIALPTVAQTLPGFFAGNWHVMLAPIGTPPLNMRKIGFDVRQAIEEPAVKDKLASIGAYVMPMSADALAGFIASQQRDWKPVAEAAAKDAAK
jgi:tripartite-type tricarboxylate transporter receptor subunit TctC